MTSPDNGKAATAREATKQTAAQGSVLTTLPAAMTGRASPAKAAVGDKPVFAYISSLPQPQRSIAERVDALAAETLPDLQRRLVLLVRRLRRPRQADVRARHVAHARAASYADRDGQGLTRRGPRITGRPRRTPSRVVDEAGDGNPRIWEAMSAATTG